MGEDYTQLPSSHPSIIVHFYGKHAFSTKPLPVAVEPSVSCEDVLIRCANHLSESLGRFHPRAKERQIGPWLLPLFGLYAANHKLQQWVPEAYMFDDNENQQEFYFRVKVRLARSRLPDGVFSDYLFWQCADDFLKGRIWDLFRENKIQDINPVTANAVLFLMGSGGYRMRDVVTCDPTRVLHTPLKDLTTAEHICKTLTFVNVHRHLPTNMPDKLKKECNIKVVCGDVFMRVLSFRHMKQTIRQVFETWSSNSLSAFRKSVTENFIDKFVPFYGLEYFAASRIEGGGMEKHVELIVRPLQDGCAPGLYFNKLFVAPLNDVYSVDLDSSGSDQSCDVQLYINHQPPVFLKMASPELGRSFLSVLETYVRLKVNYYESLYTRPQLKAPSLCVLQLLRSFGPMEDDAARDRLKEEKKAGPQHSEGEAMFILYQDSENYGLLHALSVDEDGGDKTFDICYEAAPAAQNQRGFVFTLRRCRSGSLTLDLQERQFDNHQSLIYCLSTELKLGRRIAPTGQETCGTMQLVRDEMDNCYAYAEEETRGGRPAHRSSADRGDQPVWYREDQVTIPAAPIEQREYCAVYRFKQMEHGREAILKKVTSKDTNVQEFYRKGAEQLLKLRKSCPFFVKVYGIIVTAPTRIIFEYVPDGSLLNRLRNMNASPLTWLHLASVLKQLAECVSYLKDAHLTYNSLRCEKILILREKPNGLTIRLGDPSTALFFDTLPITDIQNQKRLAWIAPELFGDLNQHTVASMVYAFGTVIWEIIWQGRDPFECIPSRNALEFFQQGNTLPDPPQFNANNDIASFQQLPAIPQEVRTRQWLQNQSNNFADPPPPEGGEEGESGDLDPYMRGALNSPDESPLESGVTLETELGDGQGGGERAEEEDKGGQTVSQHLHQLLNSVVNFRQRCHHRDPDRRPSPTDLLKMAVEVEKYAIKAEEEDPLWHFITIMQIGLDTNNVTNREAAQQTLHKIKQEHGRAALSPITMCTDLRTLEAEVSNTIKPCIILSQLDFSSSRVLGKGNFGEVWEAQLRPACMSRQAEDASRLTKGERVAVKKMTETRQSSLSELTQFLKEALTGHKLKHENVVKLKGIVMKGHTTPYMLVMEFADGGSLEKYISRVKSPLEREQANILLKLAIDIARGLKYICQDMRMIHGDLAARNVLLSSGSGQLTAKLCDFGLSHKLSMGRNGNYYYDLVRSGSKHPSIPVMWMPREFLEDLVKCKLPNTSHKELKFTINVDVWSYGVVLWEVFSRKKVEDVFREFAREGEKAVLEFYRSGQLLPQGQCPSTVYTIMKQCWDEEPDRRPKFDMLGQKLEALRNFRGWEETGNPVA